MATWNIPQLQIFAMVERAVARNMKIEFLM